MTENQSSVTYDTQVLRLLGQGSGILWVKEALGASDSKKWEPENPFFDLEIDSVLISGECATILHESMRAPVQTFCMYLGKAHSRVPASFTHQLYSLAHERCDAWDDQQKHAQI